MKYRSGDKTDDDTNKATSNNNTTVTDEFFFYAKYNDMTDIPTTAANSTVAFTGWIKPDGTKVYDCKITGKRIS